MKKITLWLVAITTTVFLYAEEPKLVEEAETLSPGLFTIDMGVFYRDNPVDFGVEDRNYEVGFPNTRFSFGVGQYVELQVAGAVNVWLEDLDGNRTTNSGDWELATKIWFLQEKTYLPSLSFLYSVKLPNGSDEQGGATDETDFFAHLLADKRLSDKLSTHVNLGLGILGNPFVNAAQNDIFTFGISFDYRWSPRHSFGLDYGGQTGPKAKDDPEGALLSYTHHRQRWAYYTSSGFGFGEDEEDLRVVLGVRRTFQFAKKAKPRRYLH